MFLLLCSHHPYGTKQGESNNNITVTAEEISGGSLDEAKGIITWQITLQPGEQRDLALRYKVKYPKGRNLIIE